MSKLYIQERESRHNDAGRKPVSHRPLQCRGPNDGMAGFTFVEVLVAVMILLILGYMAIPSLNHLRNQYTISSAARSLAAMINEAKILAGSHVTLARLNCTDRTANAAATCQVELCTTKGATPGACTTWTQEHGAQPLASPLAFQFGTITAVPGYSTQTTPAEWLQIYFNSRRVPIDVSGASPVPTGAAALYIRDTRATSDEQTYAVVVQLSGRTAIYAYRGNSWVQQ